MPGRGQIVLCLVRCVGEQAGSWGSGWLGGRESVREGMGLRHGRRMFWKGLADAVLRRRLRPWSTLLGRGGCGALQPAG